MQTERIEVASVDSQECELGRNRQVWQRPALTHFPVNQASVTMFDYNADIVFS